jgi:hypothetical protein
MGSPSPGNGHSISQPGSIWRTPKRIVNDLLEAADPQAAVQALQPQVLYSIVAQLGFSGAIELLELASREQLAAAIDFHIWQRDEIDLDKLLEVLSCTDATSSLDLLGRIVRAIDLKIISLLIARHVSVVTLDDPSEVPIEEGFVTPDNGSTWLRVETSNPDLHFNISRVLAYIYETNIQLFYQLISIPTVHTASMLEEEAYLEREKRLQTLGFPDEQVSIDVCTPLSPHELKAKLGIVSNQDATSKFVEAKNGITIEDTEPFHLKPSRRDTSRTSKLLSMVRDPGEFEGEFGFLLNVTLVRWHVNLSEIEGIREMAERVRGAIEIGLELASDLNVNELSAYEAIGLGGLFRAGLWHLLELQKDAFAVRTKADLLDLDRPTSQLLQALTDHLPALPDWWKPGMTLEAMPDAAFITKPIASLNQIADIEKLLPLIAAE